MLLVIVIIINFILGGLSFLTMTRPKPKWKLPYYLGEVIAAISAIAILSPGYFMSTYSTKAVGTIATLLFFITGIIVVRSAVSKSELE